MYVILYVVKTNKRGADNDEIFGRTEKQEPDFTEWMLSVCKRLPS